MPGDSVLDRVKKARSSLLANAKFQKFCTGFWPTRFLARAKAAEVFDLCAGFVYTQVLFACVRLDLLQFVRDESQTLAAIASKTGLPADGANRLVQAAVALDILEPRSQERYGLGAVGAAVLGNPGLQGMISHHQHFYADLRDPVGLLQARTKTTALAKYWHYSPATDQTAAERAAMQTYSDLMGDTQIVLADQVLAAYDFSKHRKLMDVGGGDGTFLRAVHDKAPRLDLHLLELPTVAERAATRFEQLGLAITAHAGNMFEDDWPDGADLITLVRVALDHDDARVEVLLARARKALAPGGRLLLAEPMTDSAKVGDAYFGLYLWAMGSGRARSSKELCAMLTRAGFSQIRVLPTGLPDIVRVISAS
ncbi:MAG: methyltransferase [Pseudomonadota bacterium]